MKKIQIRILALSGILAAGLPALANPPVGLDAITGFDLLPQFRDATRTYQASSHDPTGGNGDTGYFRFTVGTEHVLLDLLGPGCIYRIWMTGQSSTGLVRIYLDQSTTPTVQMTLGNFFSGTVAPFLSPLAVNDDVSSGGFICYLPIPFRTGCRITTTGTGHYYNIDYHLYADDSGITTFTGAEDSSSARSLWQNAGANPNPGTQTISQELTVPAGQTATLAEVSGAGTVQGIEFHLPGMEVSGQTQVTDDGRAFKGQVDFRVAIDPNNQGVRLVRRIDYGICDQKGDVYINGTPAGQWYTAGGSGGGTFYDAAFDVPANLSAGQSYLDVEIRFVSSCNDWNEFYYWTYGQIGGQWVKSDELDVGKTADETAHQYIITNQTWSGTRTFYYYTFPTGPFREILQNTRLVITWDDDTTPAVDAPLGLFFGPGTGPALVHALPFGIDTDRLYCYWPMPYATAARVQIVNESTQDIDPLQFEMRYTPAAAMPSDYGYFHALHRTEAPTTAGLDYTILDEKGTGHFVGVVSMMHSDNGSRGYLEGDERIYVDGNLTPALYGTGTEDFFNGGWYFNRGPFTLQVNGNPVHETTSGDTTVAYRLYLSDAIPFNNSIHVGIEHGAVDDFLNDITSVAFYYKRPEVTSVFNDELNIGDPASEAAHSYSTTDANWSGSLTHSYEGDNDNVSLSDTGRHLAPSTGQSTFTVGITKGCRWVMLRRRMDYGTLNQTARVYVNGTLAGLWYDAGSNTSHRFRDSEFLVPPALTTDQSSLAIRIENASASADWTEFHYWVYSYYPPPPPIKGDFDGDGDVDQEDFGHLQACLTGVSVDPPLPGCEDALLDGNEYVDQADLAIFIKCFRGPNAPPGPDCPP
jgi:hypothetical protein